MESYLKLHNAKRISKPLIDHPILGPEHFELVDNGETSEAQIVTEKLREIDRQTGWKAKIKSARDDDLENASKAHLG